MWRLIVRLLALLLTSICVVMFFCLFPPISLLFFFTHWIMMMTLLTCILVLVFAADPKIQEKKWKLAFLHLLFSVSLISSYCFLLYWILLHSSITERYQNNFWIILYMYLVHTLPSISLFLIYITTEIRVLKRQWVIMLPLHCVYDYVNYVGTKALGRPIYWFLTWNNNYNYIDCFAVCAAVTTFQCVGWIITARYMPSNQFGHTGAPKSPPKNEAKSH